MLKPLMIIHSFYLEVYYVLLLLLKTSKGRRIETLVMQIWQDLKGGVYILTTHIFDRPLLSLDVIILLKNWEIWVKVDTLS